MIAKRVAKLTRVTCNDKLYARQNNIRSNVDIEKLILSKMFGVNGN